jgi:hypothetical protein
MLLLSWLLLMLALLQRGMLLLSSSVHLPPVLWWLLLRVALWLLLLAVLWLRLLRLLLLLTMQEAYVCHDGLQQAGLQHHLQAAAQGVSRVAVQTNRWPGCQACSRQA